MEDNFDDNKTIALRGPNEPKIPNEIFIKRKGVFAW
eukprot:CAMPEP_0118677708 /NCGR_PEP_ID=MMETSP0800-20121206/2784_1 /TAXON_ID=210618 ORGANISM="Striatella unipunctata, Strain CCMP2910" /NCGR_SAMPLE_ID=MMETSP0800 /ASSEMBLY_ACC=CAM_ASM_000638 /LENGTH=35 /DNA_ID= /DNA_START= /DNA_END= /DNA_ORIENTATION=